MDYSTIYFNNTLDNIHYQDVVDFFVEAKEESTRIEFKSFSALRGNFAENLNGVIRGICAFLNSEGGVLIWGAPKGTQLRGETRKTFKGELSPVTEQIEIEKDWLINKISDSITPLPVGIEVAMLRNGDNMVCVFEVQQSNYSPHQFKNTYYARLDGQTKPAPHYLIDALFKKIRYPNLEGYIRIDNLSNNGTNYILNFSIILFNFSPFQNEENVSLELICGQGVFSGSQFAHALPHYGNDGHVLSYDNYINVLHFSRNIIHSEELIFNPYQLIEYNNEVDLLLSFGGKFSPLKYSYYKLRVNNLMTQNQNELNSLIVEKEENYLSYEKQRQLGSTRESILKDILKR